MDLAQQIVAAARKEFEQDCNKQSCDIIVNVLYNCYNYTVRVVPLPDHLLVRHKSIVYKVPRTDRDGFEDVMGFLLQAIKDEIACRTAQDELDVDGVDFDDFVDEHRHKVTIMRHGSTVFQAGFQWYKNLDETFRRYTKTLRYLV